MRKPYQITFRQCEGAELLMYKRSFTINRKRHYLYANNTYELPVLPSDFSYMKVGERYFKSKKLNKYIIIRPKGIILDTLINSYKQSTLLLQELANQEQKFYNGEIVFHNNNDEK